MKKIMYFSTHRALANGAFIAFVLLLVFNAGQAFSQGNNGKPAGTLKWTVNPFDQRVFIENKGQFDGMDGNIRFAINNMGEEVYFTPSGLTYRHNELRDLTEEEI